MRTTNWAKISTEQKKLMLIKVTRGETSPEEVHHSVAAGELDSSFLIAISHPRFLEFRMRAILAHQLEWRKLNDVRMGRTTDARSTACHWGSSWRCLNSRHSRRPVLTATTPRQRGLLTPTRLLMDGGSGSSFLRRPGSEGRGGGGGDLGLLRS